MQLYIDEFNDNDIGEAFDEDAWIFFIEANGTVHKHLIPISVDDDSMMGIPRRGRDLVEDWRTEEVRHAEADRAAAGL